LRTVAASACILLLVPLFVARGESISVSVSNRSPLQGDPVLVEVSSAASFDNLAVVWKGRAFPLKKAGEGRFLGLIGIDLSVVSPASGPAALLELALDVRERAFPVQELTLPKKMAEFDAATLARIRREAEALAGRFEALSAPAWDLPFQPPVEEYRPTNFGARRVINGEPRSPHAAVDIHLPEGTPVRAISGGTVVLSGEQFFGGRSVVLDHGGGVFSIYYHLRESAVSEGQRVAKGERIGAVGSTGRATGPHLHFGVRAAGGRVDPSLFFGPAFR
jgi:murein DD-endopeptidase MepM/ murein hydrolase activator NlpD